MIVRARRERNYSIVANDVMEHPQLSFAAKGLLVYLLSRPDDWTVSYRQLAMVGPDGEHVTRKLLRELEAAGYLVRTRISAGYRQFAWQSVVYDTPQMGKESCAEVSGVEDSGADESGAEESCAEESGIENSGAEVSGTRNPFTRERGAESSCAEVSGGEESGVEVSGAEESCAEAPGIHGAFAREVDAESSCVEESGGGISGMKDSGVGNRRQTSTVRTITTTTTTTRASSPDGEGPPPTPPGIEAALNNDRPQPPTAKVDTAPASRPPTSVTARSAPACPPAEHEQLFSAVCWLIGWEWATLTHEQRSQVGQAVGILRRAGYTIADLRRFWSEVWLSDWRWRKEKARPTLTVLRAEIGKLRVDQRDLEGGEGGENPRGGEAAIAALREQIREAKRRRRAAQSAAGEGVRLPDLQGQRLGLPGCADRRPALRQGASLSVPAAAGSGQTLAVAAAD